MIKPRINFLRLVVVFLIFIIGLFIFGNWRLMGARQKVALKLNEANKGLEAISQEKKALQGKILQNQNYDYLEFVGREDLNLKKPGEQVVAFPPQETDQETDTSQKIKDLWQKFSEMLKKEKEK
ncbi:MAG: septum formation initiator family protein [Candidatus Pacebacteria bacterium]|nr:septum formation initiator family protein [Candidatus Paceibacterota bacterium]